MVSEVPPALAPRCAAHPEEAAGATCQRCGAFLCTACSTWVTGQVYCPDCAARPEVSYLEAYRLSLWGRRDSWTWFVGFITVFLGAAAVWTLLEGAWYVPPVLFVATGIGAAFFLGMRWARFALLLFPVVVGLLLMRTFGVLGFASCLVPFATALQIFRDTRNRLFFRIDIPERELHKLWNLRVNNAFAQRALSVGLSSLIFPPVAPLGVVFGIIGLMRVDPEARPPIGRRGQAIAGIAFSVAAVLLWALFILPWYQSNYGWMAGV